MAQVYDTAKFPFYQAEVYHQFRKYMLKFGLFAAKKEMLSGYIFILSTLHHFHLSHLLVCVSDDDFQSKAYGKKYNQLADQAFDEGRLKVTGCPDRV